MQNIIDQLQFGIELECLDPEKKYMFTLHLGCPENDEHIIGGGGLDGYQIGLLDIDTLSSGSTSCPGVITCVNNYFNSPGLDGNTIFVEMVQDAIGDVFEGFNYNDAINTWLQENPITNAGNISYDNTASLLDATNVQDAIDEIIADTSIELYENGEDNGIRYTKANGVIVDLKTGHTKIITPVPNVATVITHNLNSRRVHVEAYDILANNLVSVEVQNRTLNTVEIVSTTSDNLEVIIKR